MPVPYFQHKWFAWYPVYLNDCTKWVWLREVVRTTSMSGMRSYKLGGEKHEKVHGVSGNGSDSTVRVYCSRSSHYPAPTPSDSDRAPSWSRCVLRRSFHHWRSALLVL